MHQSNHLLCWIAAVVFGDSVIPTLSYTSCEDVAIPSLTKQFVTPDDDPNMVFLDVNGLSGVVESPFGVEFLGTEFGFLEGPLWIQDDSYLEGGYLLFTATNDDIIWKYFVNDNKTAKLECFSVDFETLGPNALAWNKNYPNELWVAFWHSNRVSRYDINTKKELNRFTQDVSGNEIISPNDIVVDSNGNAYFTTFPALFSDPTLVGGTWRIARKSDNTFEVNLIETLTYGPNGIAMTLDESLIVASNALDFPLGEMNVFDFEQVNHDNLYLRGYNLTGNDNNNNCDDETCLGIVGFNYYVCSSNPSFFGAGLILDSSEFDNFGNLWQAQESMLLAGGPLGNAVIINPIAHPNNPIIGTITFGKDTAPSNFGYDATNGYMYATLGDYASNFGKLARIKLKKD